MTILCDPRPAAADIAAAIGGNVVAADNLGSVARLLNNDPAETLVVIGPTVTASEALRFAAALRPVRPSAGVIVIREHVDVGMLTEALRAGIREVVADGDHASLAAACRRSRNLTAKMRAPEGTVTLAGPAREGRVVTVFAAKGGCGKTTLAINIGVALAGLGQRVCVIDLDLAFGDIAISVQLDPVRTILDAVPMTGHVDATGANSLLSRYRPGLEMLLAPVTPGDAEKIQPTLVRELLGVLGGMFDYLVVDTPSQFSEHVLTAMDCSAHLVLLTTPDVPALKNLRVAMDTLDLLSYPRDNRSVVLNRSDAKVGLTADDVVRVVRTPIAAHVPSSRDVSISINKGVPISIDSPGHPVSQSINKFARQVLLDQQEPTAAPGPLAHRRGRRSR